MTTSISNVFKMAISLILSSILILFMSVLGTLGYSEASRLDTYRASRDAMYGERLVYRCDGKLVTATDLVYIIQMNIRRFNFTIDTNSVVTVISKDMESTVINPLTAQAYGVSLWSISYLTDIVLTGHMDRDFHATLVRDTENNGVITGIHFKLQ